MAFFDEFSLVFTPYSQTFSKKLATKGGKRNKFTLKTKKINESGKNDEFNLKLTFQNYRRTTTKKKNYHKNKKI